VSKVDSAPLNTGLRQRKTRIRDNEGRLRRVLAGIAERALSIVDSGDAKAQAGKMARPVFLVKADNLIVIGSCFSPFDWQVRSR
jgi:hypothetical protein